MARYSYEELLAAGWALVEVEETFVGLFDLGAFLSKIGKPSLASLKGWDGDCRDSGITDKDCHALVRIASVAGLGSLELLYLGDGVGDGGVQMLSELLGSTLLSLKGFGLGGGLTDGGMVLLATVLGPPSFGDGFSSASPYEE